MTVTDQQLITEIKTRLGITGNYQDSLLLSYANDVKNYLIGGGVSPNILEDEKSIGAISIGVNDLWINKSWSTAFLQRVVQLRLMGDSYSEFDGAFEEITHEEIDECTECLEE